MTRRVAGLDPPMRNARMHGLRKLLTHQALARKAGLDKSHRHIAACFDFYNGFSWRPSSADSEGVAHFCKCCASDEESQLAGVAALRDVLMDCVSHDFVPSRWQKKVTPAQLWCTLFLCGNTMADIAFRCSSKYSTQRTNNAGGGDNLVFDFLARKKSKFAAFCKDPATPFVLGIKSFVLVSLEPLVLTGFGMDSCKEKQQKQAPRHQEPPGEDVQQQQQQQRQQQ